jgi:TolB-like protein/DNA-binding winged helix-turn-helix (wHTH) protein/Tfp pilus assembly protein PilF
VNDPLPPEPASGDATAVRLVAGALSVDLRTETAFLEGEALELRGKPYRLLVHLMALAPSLVTKDEIIDAVWGGLSVSDAVLTTAIREARMALGDNARTPRWIKTAHGRGYRFIAPVTPVTEADASSEPGATVLAPDPARPAAEAASAAPRQPLLLGLRLAHALIGAVLVIAIGVIAAFTLGLRTPSAPDQSVAVLGFDAYSEDGDALWFADGLSEEISAALGRTPDLQVASRRASLPYDGDTQTSLAAIGQALNVAHLVDGSVRLDGERVRVTVSLIEAATGVQRWSDTYDRDFADILDLQGDIARHVAQVLDTALDAEALDAMVAAGTDSIAAYEAYLRAQAAITEFNRTGDSGDWAQALPLLDRARSIDPDFAEAHAVSALVFRYLNTPSLVMGPDPLTGEAYLQAYSERMNAAVAAARHPLQAAVYRGRREQELFNLDAARQAYEAYLAERPNDTDRLFDYSNTLVMMGRHDEARAVVRRLDALIAPSDTQNRGMLIQHARKARDFDLAVDIASRTLQIAPYHGFSLIEAQLAMHYAGRHDEAAAIAARIQESELGRFAKLFSEIYRLCAAGDGAQAVVLGQMFIDEPRALIQGYNMLRLSGREDAAYARLAELDEPGVPGRLREMLFDPSFDARRFANLAEAVERAGGTLAPPEPFLALCPPES